jgi:hypothetical protein
MIPLLTIFFDFHRLNPVVISEVEEWNQKVSIDVNEKLDNLLQEHMKKLNLKPNEGNEEQLPN